MPVGDHMTRHVTGAEHTMPIGLSLGLGPCMLLFLVG
jgi:hypothetical protein